MPFLILFGLMAVIFWVMQRRASGQVNGIMSIGRSRAKTYSSERPGTTFADVAGYEGVKQEIREVVDFLKFPDRFGQIGARIPKGVLLVGPPGTGKTLIARAVAGEAGVPFLSVTGSDFMEMFVGVGASRVRDLFQTARKMGRAIIFVDEIDSIGRKRGAGLGGGHDEREQTLNQMLSEMDGFEATEGIVMIAATNRPDILDPALLRPGRFDRQVVVPLPELSERLAVLNVHAKGKSVGSDVDMSVVARGTPGMSGADLANLVNEAALHAVREDRNDRHDVRLRLRPRPHAHGPAPRVARHVRAREGAHRLPRGRPRRLRRGAPQRRPASTRSRSSRWAWRSASPCSCPRKTGTATRRTGSRSASCVAMGGRIAEQLVFGVMSSGASNDLVTSTEFARRMVREFGMSDRIGPMAWGSQQQVFLGDDLMHTREYSDETARVIDEEVEHILRSCEDRCRAILTEYRYSLDLVARGAARARDHRRRRGRAPRRARSLRRQLGGGGGGLPTGGPGTGGGDSSASVPSAAGLTRSPYPGSTEPRTVPVTEPAGGEHPAPRSEPAHASDAEPATADDDRPAVWAHRHGATPPPAT